MVLKVVVEEDLPSGTLKFFQDQCDKFEAVIVIGLERDGSQHIRSSRCSGETKAFLIAFANAWMVSWFGLDRG